MKTKPTKACNDFLQYLLNYFDIKKPVNFVIEDVITLQRGNHKGYKVTDYPVGTAEPIPYEAPTRFEIKLSLKQHRNKYSLFSTLAHEVGHLVQYENGRHLVVSYWELEIEASRIGDKPYREYLALHHPKILNRLGKPLAAPEWLQEKVGKVNKVIKQNIQMLKPAEQWYQLVSHNGEVYKVPV